MTDKSYYKNLRAYKGISLRKLSELTGIHYQQINRFEEGKTKLSEEQIKIIQEILGFSALKDTESYQRSLKIFHEFYRDAAYDNIDFDKYEKLIHDKPTDINEKIVFLVMKYAICMIKGDIKGSLEIEPLLSKYIIENEYVGAVYMDYKAFRIYLDKQQSKAVEIYKQILATKCDEVIEGMVNYHLGFAYRELNQFKNAITVFLKAKEIFMKTGNTYRIFACDLMIGNVELRSRDYIGAENHYNNCIAYGKSINIKYTEIAKVYRNLTWLMIKKKDYAMAEFYLEKAKILEDNHWLLQLYCIWINYKKEKYNTAVKVIQKCKTVYNNSEMLMILNLFDNLCYLGDRKPSLNLVKQAIKVYEFYKKTNDVDLTLFYLELVLDLLKRRNDLENLVYYQNEKIILLEK